MVQHSHINKPHDYMSRGLIIAHVSDVIAPLRTHTRTHTHAPHTRTRTHTHAYMCSILLDHLDINLKSFL